MSSSPNVARKRIAAFVEERGAISADGVGCDLAHCMHVRRQMSLADLSNEALAARLHQLLGDERRVQVEFLLHLEEFDRREEWRRLGYATLWQYCRRELGLLENAIFHRVTAIRLLRRFPAVEDRLRDGRLCLTTLVDLKDLLSPETAEELLERAAGKSKREVEELVAARKAPVPAPIARAAIRALPPAQPLPAKPFEAPGLSFGDPAPAAAVPAQAPPAQAVNPPRIEPRPEPRFEPRPEPRFEIKLVVSRQFMESLEYAKRRLSHSVPNGDTVGVLHHCLERLLAQDAKKHSGLQEPRAARAEAQIARQDASRPDPPRPDAPRPDASRPDAPRLNAPRPDAPRQDASRRDAPRQDASRRDGSWQDAPEQDSPEQDSPEQDSPTREAARQEPPLGSRRKAVPAAVVRAVWMRDGGCCQWKLAKGGICGSRWRVQLDHTVPVAMGGESTEAACRLLCRIHNVEAARQVFGDQVMDRYRGRPAT